MTDAPSPPSRGRLTRPRHDKMIAGVCSGLGRYFGHDPVIWRIGFVVLFLVGPGFFAYLVAAIFIPKDGEPDTGRALSGRILQAVGVLVVLAGLTGVAFAALLAPSDSTTISVSVGGSGSFSEDGSFEQGPTTASRSSGDDSTWLVIGVVITAVGAGAILGGHQLRKPTREDLLLAHQSHHSHQSDQQGDPT